MQGAVIHLTARGAQILPAPALPLETLLRGRPVAEAAQMLPRLFNLCREAQGLAARLALGLTPTAPDADPGAPAPNTALRGEILRDHGAKLLVTLRRSFDLAPLPLQALTPALLFGAAGRMPQNLADLAQWQATDLPAAALLREITTLFAPHSATTRALPPPEADPLAEGAHENSPAGRQAAHPLLQAVAATRGRGPLWRALGILADAEAALADRLPPPRLCGPTALVPAARGSYALRIDQAGGKVTGLTRRTPTDHILAPGGALQQALSRVHPSLAPRVLALHDPCVPVTLQEVIHA